MYGQCVGNVWAMYGQYVGNVWAICGQCMGFLFHFRTYTIPYVRLVRGNILESDTQDIFQEVLRNSVLGLIAAGIIECPNPSWVHLWSNIWLSCHYI